MVQNKELETDDFQFALASKFSEIESKILDYQKTWTENIPKIIYSSPISKSSQFAQKGASESVAETGQQKQSSQRKERAVEEKSCREPTEALW